MPDVFRYPTPPRHTGEGRYPEQREGGLSQNLRFHNDRRGKPQPHKPSTDMDPGLRQDDGLLYTSYRTCFGIQQQLVIPAKAGIQSNGKFDCPKISESRMIVGENHYHPSRLRTWILACARMTTAKSQSVLYFLDQNLPRILACARMTDYCIRHAGLDPVSSTSLSYRRRPVSSSGGRWPFD